MLQKILVPMDGSECAKAIVPYVREISQRCESVEIVLLHVIPEPHGRSSTLFKPQDSEFSDPMPDSEVDVERARHPIYRDQEIESARAQAEAVLTPIAHELRDENTSVLMDVAFGRPADEIVRFAERENIDLIAMCTHGRSGLGRWIMGSVAEKVLRGTYLPILLARPPQVTRSPFPFQPDTAG
jgi:nucleotide-binding universal stress UspA family protein